MNSVRSLLCVCVVAWLVLIPSIAAAAAPGTKAPAPGAKKAEPAKIEGIEVPRAAGGFLGVALVGGSFKISFYDAKKLPVQANVTRALLRWDPKGRVGQERVMLNRSADGLSLSAPKNIRPPYVFKLFITLLQDTPDSAEGTATETYVIDFRA